jgi:hypothetical protein
MTQENTVALAAESHAVPPVDLTAGSEPAASQTLQSYLDFEVQVAAGQVWLAMPGHADCRAMYPNHARALANAIEQIAAGGGERTVVLAHDVSLLILRQGPDLVLIREDLASRPNVRNALETPADAYRLARRVREAADRAARGIGLGHAA